MTQAQYDTHAPARDRAARRSRPAPVLVRPSAAAAVRAALSSLVLVEIVVLVLWAAERQSGSSASQAARSGLVAWEWVHHSFVHVPGGTVSFTPPLFVLLPFWMIRRTAKRLHPDVLPLRWQEALRDTLLIALPYAAIGAVVSMFASTSAIEAEALSSAIGPLLVAVVGAGSWCWRAVTREWLDGAPPALRAATRGGLAGLAVLGLAGALATTLSLIWHFRVAADLSSAITTSAGGSLGLLLLNVAALPAACTWAAAVAAGPGFSLGAHTAITAGTVHVGGVPAFALAAALPQSGHASWGLRILPVAMVLAGLIAGSQVHRRAADSPLANRCGWALIAGLTAGLGMAIVAALSSGAVAPGRLETVGASAWRVGLAVTEEVGLIAALSVLVLHWWSRRAQQQA